MRGLAGNALNVQPARQSTINHNTSCPRYNRHEAGHTGTYRVQTQSPVASCCDDGERRWCHPGPRTLSEGGLVIVDVGSDERGCCWDMWQLAACMVNSGEERNCESAAKM